jgi:hypothetical protein
MIDCLQYCFPFYISNLSHHYLNDARSLNPTTCCLKKLLSRARYSLSLSLSSLALVLMAAFPAATGSGKPVHPQGVESTQFSLVWGLCRESHTNSAKICSRQHLKGKQQQSQAEQLLFSLPPSCQKLIKKLSGGQRGGLSFFSEGVGGLANF